MALAIVFGTLLGLLSIFQLALAAGAPWGRLAWGGRHAGTLPVAYRFASVIAMPVYLLIGAFALDLAGLVDLIPNAVSQIVMWVAFGLFCLGVVTNARSRAAPERWTMTPLALVLAVLALVIAVGGPLPQSFAGTVLDDGDGPVYCTTVMESYPPQCGGDSPRVSEWNWDAVDHEQARGVRWGEYRFEGLRDGDTITLVGIPTPTP